MSLTALSAAVMAITSIAMLGVTIAIYSTNNNQTKVQVFKERFEIYQGTLKLINNFLDKEWISKRTYEDRTTTINNFFDRNLMKSQFIFGSVIYNHLNNIKDLTEKVAIHRDQILTIANEEKEFSPYKELKKYIDDCEFTKPFLQFLNFPGVK